MTTDYTRGTSRSRRLGVLVGVVYYTRGTVPKTEQLRAVQLPKFHIIRVFNEQFNGQNCYHPRLALSYSCLYGLSQRSVGFWGVGTTAQSAARSD